MTALVIKSCGPMTSLQDRGRYGYQRFGVSPSGAMDRRGLAMANALVGNAPWTVAIEFVHLGGALTASGGDVLIALAGADCSLAIDGKAVAPRTAALLKEGQTAEVGHARRGTFAYLAAAGGFAVPASLGSRSLHLRSRMGGLDGRPLQANDRLDCAATGGPAPLMRLPDDPAPDDGPIRVMLGPQDDYFTPEAIRTFLESEFTVSSQADRMGFQLSGPVLEHAKGFNIVSDGIVEGHVQVPGSGQPIVLMRDRQTAGGYPKIATVIGADLDRLAQVRPGSPVRFRAVDREEAVAAARAFRSWVEALPRALVPVRLSPTTEDLLAANLIGGAVHALDPNVPE
ncbi:biotin-dependent carboxyltransferase family protein [Microvirga thermotolerans]|uniref:5-oxoprolinase/urea amidolyase family protein n=1 Tax=Microvirga thermotolerans TaxID=2651334 RepID=A0A5P9JXY6_9HYPH|nr:biotin-dependent carboxyltransferase family protein [Microvirga thermotolerans]QFU17477.1 5-oxoprolinase/urea amidolyase family protein [Microvirga thermotolerans]